MLDSVFAHMDVDLTWVEHVRKFARMGPIVYVLRNRNRLDFLALEYLTRRFDLPPLQLIKPDGRGIAARNTSSWTRFVGALRQESSAEQLARVLSTPGTAGVLFLKKPPGPGGSRGLDVREGEAQVEALITHQQQHEVSIHLIPLVILWTKRPDTLGTGRFDWLFGPREWPSALRATGQLLLNREKICCRGGQPVNFQEFLSAESNQNGAPVRRRLVFTLLRRLERERRSVVGPAGKPPARVRQELLRSQTFRKQLDKLAPTPEAKADALKKADAMLQKMQALPDGASHKLLDSLLTRLFERIYAGLEIDEAGVERLRQLSKEGSLILLPSHKSYIDFLVVSYALYQKNLPMPLIVAGDNLSFFPVGSLARHAGAFFIRRTFRGDRLYAAVVDTYVKRLLKEGYAFEVFLEGKRSRSGKLLEPKLGLLNMLINAAKQPGLRPVYFVPVSIGYERIIETASHQKELSGQEKVQEGASGLLGATKILRHRYGRLNLQFGQCLTIPGMAKELGFDAGQGLNPKQTRLVVSRLGNRALDEINSITAATPGALTALTLLSHNRKGLTHKQLTLTAGKLVHLLHRQGVRLAPALATETGELRPESIREAAEMFVDAGMVTKDSVQHTLNSAAYATTPSASADVIYQLTPNKRLELDTSKNMLIHFFTHRALLAIAMPSGPSSSITQDLLEERTIELFELFKHEFRLQGTGTFESTLGGLLSIGLLKRTPDGELTHGPGTLDWSSTEWLNLLASMLRNFLECYLVCATAVAGFSTTALGEKESAQLALKVGRRMLNSGEIERPEAVTKPSLQNALLTFQERGFIKQTQGKVLLTDDPAKLDELKVLARRLGLYLERQGSV